MVTPSQRSRAGLKDAAAPRLEWDVLVHCSPLTLAFARSLGANFIASWRELAGKNRG